MNNNRALIVTVVVVFIFFALAAKLFTIQISNHEYYKLLAEKQQNKPQNVKAERGLIQDVNGEVLTYTRDNISFYVDTRMAKKYETAKKIAEEFSKVMQKEKNYYLNIIENGSKNVCIEKKVPMNKALLLKRLPIEGLTFKEDFTRVYPYGSLASHILGYVDYELQGQEGIEKKFDNHLKGVKGNFIFERDVLGRIISFDETKSTPPIPGSNIKLTINKSYQQILEEALINGINKFGGEYAVGIIMNPNTGEILSLANLPNFDPANYQIFEDANRRNRAITDTYEPGSTIKSISLAILFDQNLAKVDEKIETDKGKFTFRSITFSDTHPSEVLTVREILEKSSNVGAVKLSQRISEEQFYKYYRDFGFGNPTSIDLPGETSGKLKKPNRFTPHTKMFMAHGYELSVSPIQMVSAFSALINGGNLYQPFIIKEITDHTGKVLEHKEPIKIRGVVKKSTSDLIRELMIGVVEHGTGIEAQLENVLVGGKTGTAQLLINNSYSSNKHNSSFIGFFPAENPKVVCFILVSAPHVGSYGGLVAAPIFKEVAEKIVAADLTLFPEKKKIERNKNLIDQFMTDLKTAPRSTSRSYLNVSNEIQNKNVNRKFFIESKTTMPDLVNRSMRDAITQLNELGLEYQITGIGKVFEQSILPGAAIAPGDTCFIKCQNTKQSNSVRIN
jgi:cell division protein FtsI/penicillin-binding protein 2